jgi:hypothetical protein
MAQRGVTAGSASLASRTWSHLATAVSVLAAWARKHRTVLWVAAIGLLVRYSLAIYSAEGDTVNFGAASASMAFGQPPYSYLILYPPGWVFTLGLIGRTFSLFSSPGSILVVPNGLTSLVSLPFAWYESPYQLSISFDLTLKSFLFVFDFLTAVLIYVILLERTRSPRAAQIGFALWILNPAVVMVSAIHGTYDSIPAFLTLLAYYLATKTDFIFAGVALGLGTVMKVFPIILFPLFLLLIWDLTRASRRNVFQSWGLFSVAFAVVLVLVFWPPGVFQQWFTLFFTGTSRGGEPFGGFNEWAFLSLPGASPTSALLTANATKVLAAAIIELLIAFVYILWQTVSSAPRHGAALDRYWDGVFVLALCLTYLIVPLAQPQYMLWVLPWLVLVVLLYSFTQWFAWVPYAVISGGVTLFYFFGLTSPLFFFQPLVFNTRLLGLQALQASLTYWSGISLSLDPLFEIPVALMLLVTGWIGVRLAWPSRGHS